MKRIRIIAIISAIIFAFALYLYLSSLNKPEEIIRDPVVVAVKEIREGQEITSDMVAIKEIPKEAIVSMAASRLDVIVGRISSTNVKPDEQLLVSKVFKAGETKSGLAYTVDKGMRAYTVPVDQVTGVAGFINPKDRVDVLAILDINTVLSPEQFNDMLNKKNNVEDDEPKETTAPGQSQPAASGQSQPMRMVFSMILLQDIQVLATGQVMKQDDTAAAPVVVETVTLSVTPEQALRLNLVMTEGNVRLVLRSPGDKDLPDLEGLSVANLIDSSDVDILTLLGELAPTASPKASKDPEATTSPEPTASPEPTVSPKAAS